MKKLTALLLLIIVSSHKPVYGQINFITTLAGSGAYIYGGDGGPAILAAVWGPQGIVTDSTGNVYYMDFARCVMRKVTVSTGIITHIAGSYPTYTCTGDGGPASAATFRASDPINVMTIDAAGNIFTNEYGRIRKINMAGIISTFAGGGGGICYWYGWCTCNGYRAF